MTDVQAAAERLDRLNPLTLEVDSAESYKGYKPWSRIMSEVQLVATAAMTLPDLRRRFKAICVATEQSFQKYQIRVHRALSWRERALDLPSGKGWMTIKQ